MLSNFLEFDDSSLYNIHLEYFHKYTYYIQIQIFHFDLFLSQITWDDNLPMEWFLIDWRKLHMLTYL